MSTYDEPPTTGPDEPTPGPDQPPTPPVPGTDEPGPDDEDDEGEPEPAPGAVETEGRAGTLGALALMRLAHFGEDLRAMARTTVGEDRSWIETIAAQLDELVAHLRRRRDRDRLSDEAREHPRPADHPAAHAPS